MNGNVMAAVVACICTAMAGCGGSDRQHEGNQASSRVGLQEEMTYYGNGRPKKRILFYRDSVGHIVVDGRQAEWYDNGQVWMETDCKDGRVDGEQTEWYSDGTKKMYGIHRNGKETGVWQAWQPTGEKMWEATYKDGKIVGSKTWWMKDNVVRVEHYGKDGVINELETWGDNGAKECRGSYTGGEQDGTWTYWYLDGRVKAIGEWKNGKPWSGICLIPAAGDAGSWAGLGTFRLYKNGVDVGPAVLPPASSAPATTGK